MKPVTNKSTNKLYIRQPCNDRSIVIFRLKGDFHG